MEKLKLTSSQLPSYTMTLPISGIVTKYRPFLVKEEKVLLIAAQSGDMNQIVDAMRNIISACTNGLLDTKKLCTADAEYAFLQIRMKSVGEEVKPQIACSTCQTKTGIRINLQEVKVKKVEKESVDSTVKINDQISLVLRYPSMHDVDYSKSEIDAIFGIAKDCIESVIFGDNVYSKDDIDPKELAEFVDNLLPEQFEQIMKFVKTTPELAYGFKYTCPSCKKLVETEVKSVSDFFQ
jgi:hypothetical protein